MSRRKKWMFAAAILFAAGVLLCVISFALLGFDFDKLSTVKYVTNTYEVLENFHKITINADTEEISFVLSEDENCRVICLEEENDPHKVIVNDDNMIIERKNRNGKHFNMGITLESPTITVYLPSEFYEELTVISDTGDVSIPAEFSFGKISITLDSGDVTCGSSVKNDIYIKTDTGNIAVTDLSASDLELATDTGGIEASGIVLSGDMIIGNGTGITVLNNISCKNLASNGDTGNLRLTNVIAAGEFQIERDTGDVEFNGCDASAIFVRTKTGNVSGTLLNDMAFITQTDTGNVDVPKTITGGRCEISTDTGDIHIKTK